MRRLLPFLFLASFVLVSLPARAQFCPGAAPWVFDDVPVGDPFCGYITWAAQNGITLGCGIIDANHRLYCPNDGVSRSQMAAFVNRLGNVRVEAVGTGPGLTGGPITSIGTINLATTQLLPTTACAASQIPKWNGSAWTCAADATGTGTVTSLTAGTGITLTPSPITTTGSIAVNTTTIQQRVTGNCGVGSYIRAIAADGTVTCGTDNTGTGTVTSVATGAGLQGGAITTSGTVDLRLNAAGGLAKNLGAGTNELGIADGGVATAKIANAAVTAAKLAPGAAVAGLPACIEGQIVRRTGGTWVCGNVPPALAELPFNTKRFASLYGLALDAMGVPSTLGIINDFSDINVTNRIVLGKCANASCAGIIATQDVQDTFLTTSAPAIAIPPDNLPFIAVGELDELRFLKCNDPSCVSHSNNGASIFGLYRLALAIPADGKPVVSFYNKSGTNLALVKCADAACTSAGVNIVDTLAQTGRFNAIAVGSDGLPVIAYRDDANSALKVAKCSNATCSGSLRNTVEANDAGLAPSIAIGADGFPVIATYRGAAGQLIVVKCGNLDCSSRVVNVVDSVPSSVAYSSSIAIGIDGFPIVSYYDTVNQDLKFAKCLDAACATSQVRVMDSIGDVGNPSYLKVAADGMPVIAYEQASNSTFRVLRCSNIACASP